MRDQLRRPLRVLLLLVAVVGVPVGIAVTATGVLNDEDGRDRLLPAELVISAAELPDAYTARDMLVIPTGAALTIDTPDGSAGCFTLVGGGGDVIEGERFQAVADETMDDLLGGLDLGQGDLDLERTTATSPLGDQAVAYTGTSSTEEARGILWRHRYAISGCFHVGAGASGDAVTELAGLQQAKLERLLG